MYIVEVISFQQKNIFFLNLIFILNSTTYPLVARGGLLIFQIKNKSN